MAGLRQHQFLKHIWPLFTTHLQFELNKLRHYQFKFLDLHDKKISFMKFSQTFKLSLGLIAFVLLNDLF